MKYVVILPAKNEQIGIRKALESILRQTIRPRQVLVIDDHSDDGTLDIVKLMANDYSCLTWHTTTSARNYELGGHVVRLFREGKRLIDAMGIQYEWIVKLDADVECEPDFIAEVERRIHGSRIGIVSGTPYFDTNGRKIFDTSPAWHTHGQFKIYNLECYNQYGGPREHLGWDCADNVLAISAGWQTLAIGDVNYRMHRAVGGKQSIVRGRINHGIGCYQCGFGLGYFLLKVVHDLFKPPPVLGSISLLRGYFRAAIKRYPKVLSSDQRRLLRTLLWSSLWVRLKDMDFPLQQRLFPRKQP